MIEAGADVEALIDRLIQHARHRQSLGTQGRRAARSETNPDWRSPSSLWPGFAKD